MAPLPHRRAVAEGRRTWRGPSSRCRRLGGGVLRGAGGRAFRQPRAGGRPTRSATSAPTCAAPTSTSTPPWRRIGHAARAEHRRSVGVLLDQRVACGDRQRLQARCCSPAASTPSRRSPTLDDGTRRRLLATAAACCGPTSATARAPPSPVGPGGLAVYGRRGPAVPALRHPDPDAPARASRPARPTGARVPARPRRIGRPVRRQERLRAERWLGPRS